MNVDGLVVGVSLAAVSGMVLFADARARARARAIEAAQGEQQAHELRVLLKRMLPVAAALAIRSGVAADAGFLLIGYLAINPVLFGLLAPVLARILGADAVSDELQGRLSRLADQAGVRVRGRVIRARTRKVANAAQIGWLPGMCYVMITDYALLLAALGDHGPTVYIACMTRSSPTPAGPGTGPLATPAWQPGSPACKPSQLRRQSASSPDAVTTRLGPILTRPG